MYKQKKNERELADNSNATNMKAKTRNKVHRSNETSQEITSNKQPDRQMFIHRHAHALKHICVTRTDRIALNQETH